MCIYIYIYRLYIRVYKLLHNLVFLLDSGSNQRSPSGLRAFPKAARPLGTSANLMSFAGLGDAAVTIEPCLFLVIELGKFGKTL